MISAAVRKDAADVVLQGELADLLADLDRVGFLKVLVQDTETEIQTYLQSPGRRRAAVRRLISDMQRIRAKWGVTDDRLNPEPWKGYTR